MTFPSILAALDAEIARLQSVHALLSQTSEDGPRRGRPPGSKNGSKNTSKPVKTVRKKRTMSAEGRKAISEAQRKRHAALKKAKKVVKIQKVAPKAGPKKRVQKSNKTANTALSSRSEVVAAPKSE